MQNGKKKFMTKEDLEEARQFVQRPAVTTQKEALYQKFEAYLCECGEMTSAVDLSPEALDHALGSFWMQYTKV